MGATNRLTIVNGVLSNFANEKVSVLSETPNSRIIESQLDRLLSEYLESTLSWQFAKTTVELKSPELQSLSNQWKYTFKMPSDYLRWVRVYDYPNDSFEFRGSQVLTNYPSITLDYLRNTVDFSRFPPHFVRGLIYYISMELCMPITRQLDLTEYLVKKYEGEVYPEIKATEMKTRGGIESRLNPKPLTGVRSISV